MTKKELIELVTKICELDSTEEELNEYVYQFNNSGVPHPAPSDLIFWDFRNLTPEEIVEIALNYKEEK
ncbi:bacteriocin immunity protein [Bacillus cereus group sp. BfR-BA-01380]|uniref:bacteriocin immunity protein n=1 Tax=Bacillus cereus group sp. BfR-BA-01380 TaxID=2920324 RepID=UPI001F58AD4B|nr:bacteriocin immunity protein [Bacillus cereus group sp. BfR-BA-01380]